MPSTGLFDVLERARHVRQVAGLAVTVPQAREDAARLEVALHSHQVEPAQELLLVRTHRKPCRVRPAAEIERPADDAVLRPGDVAVPQQRDQVVAERSVDRVLEIEDARIVPRADHQVARVVIAVHEHSRLRERVGHERVEHLCQGPRRVRSEAELQVPSSSQSVNRLISKRSSFSS